MPDRGRILSAENFLLRFSRIEISLYKPSAIDGKDNLRFSNNKVLSLMLFKFESSIIEENLFTTETLD